MKNNIFEDIEYEDIKEKYISTLEIFDFEIRVCHDNIFHRYYVYFDEWHYTNIHGIQDGKVNIHINMKSSPNIPFSEETYNNLFKLKFLNLNDDRNYNNEIYTLNITTDIEHLFKVLSVLYPKKLRLMKLERIIDE